MDLSPNSLEEALRELETTIGQAGIRADHLFPDLALLGFGRDVFEHGAAVGVLWDSDVPRTCHASARSAFEAALDVMFLGTRRDDYDYWGARARAAELLDWEYGASLVNDSELDLDPIEQRPTAEQLEEDVAIWEKFSPGKGVILREAMADVKQDRDRYRFHWTGHSRTHLPQEFVNETGGNGASIAIYKSIYSLLSLHSHPSPRIERRSLRIEEGTFRFQVSGAPDELAGAALAASYLSVVSAAVVVREHLHGENGANAQEEPEGDA